MNGEAVCGLPERGGRMCLVWTMRRQPLQFGLHLLHEGVARMIAALRREA